MSEKNSVLAEALQGLTDSLLIKSFRAGNIVSASQFKSAITRKAAPVDSPTHLEIGLAAGNSVEIPHRICEQLIGSYAMNLMQNKTRFGVEDTYDHTWMIPHQCKNGDNESGMAHIVHRREIIGIAGEVLVALLVGKWRMGTIMGIITMAIGVVLIIKGVASKPSKLHRKRKH